MGIIALAHEIAYNNNTIEPTVICENYGIHVHIHPLIDCRGYYMKAFGQDYITISEDLVGVVKRFVCAHELGHYLLHQRFNRIFMDYRTRMIPDRFENEADKFAMHLLYGAPPLYQEPVSYQEMAEILNVPLYNVDARLIELGIHW